MPENLKHPERDELWRLATGALPERESERLAVQLKALSTVCRVV